MGDFENIGTSTKGSFEKKLLFLHPVPVGSLDINLHIHRLEQDNKLFISEIPAHVGPEAPFTPYVGRTSQGDGSKAQHDSKAIVIAFPEASKGKEGVYVDTGDLASCVPLPKKGCGNLSTQYIGAERLRDKLRGSPYVQLQVICNTHGEAIGDSYAIKGPSEVGLSQHEGKVEVRRGK